jgi:hypothetical protein
MKTKILLPVVLFIIIVILGGSLIYEICDKKKAVENAQKQSVQFFISVGVPLYQGLERGDVEAVKRRLGGDLIANAELYEKTYGHETDPKFSQRLAEVEAIRAEFQTTGK